MPTHFVTHNQVALLHAVTGCLRLPGFAEHGDEVKASGSLLFCNQNERPLGSLIHKPSLF